MEKKVDILLVNAFSWTTEKRPCYLPYGILYLASYLRQRGINTAVYDRNNDFSLNITKCIGYFKKIKPRIVGLSVLTGPVINDALNISRAIKSVSPETIILWGGLHPTLFPEHVLKEKSVDFIIQGEGEAALHELCAALLTGGDYSGIRNLGFRNNGGVVLNPMRTELLDLNTNPMPAWDLLDMKYYLAKRFFAGRVLTLSTSRGCPFKCAFCFNQGLPHQKWRALNAENMLRQITHVKKEYGINGIQFYEDSFDTDKNRVKEFCRLMIGNKVKVNWSHFSNIIYCDADLIRLEKQANCKYIEYGVESGSDRILKMINKRQDVSQIKAVFDTCKKAGLKTAALFMIGYPTETEKELKETVELVEGLPAHILICTIYRPYPATPLHDYCVENKKFRVPESLDEQGEFYRFSHMGKDADNLSEVPTAYLLKLQQSFYAKFALKEAFLCLSEFNFSLLFYYLKQQLAPRDLFYTLKALFTRMGLRIASKGQK